MHYNSVELELDYAGLELEAPCRPAALTTYFLDTDEQYLYPKRPVVLICPGGGYREVCPREGEPIALAMNGHGFHAAVLNYSVSPPTRFPGSLLELSLAVAYLRNHAEEFHIDENRILVCGFSAGGHLAASLGVYWKEGFVQRYLGLDADENRPNGLILCYPVISGREGVTHSGSMSCLMGSVTESVRDLFSLEEHVSDLTPPAFLWHAANDPVVPAENSLRFAQALAAHDIPYELHIFPDGGHGMCLANQATAAHLGDISAVCQSWLGLAVGFVTNL